jgi:hypothetical protein
VILNPNESGTAIVTAQVSNAARAGDVIPNTVDFTFNPTYTATVSITVLPGSLPATGEPSVQTQLPYLIVMGMGMGAVVAGYILRRRRLIR